MGAMLERVERMVRLKRLEVACMIVVSMWEEVGRKVMDRCSDVVVEDMCGIEELVSWETDLIWVRNVGRWCERLLERKGVCLGW